MYLLEPMSAEPTSSLYESVILSVCLFMVFQTDILDLGNRMLGPFGSVVMNVSRSSKYPADDCPQLKAGNNKGIGLGLVISLIIFFNIFSAEDSLGQNKFTCQFVYVVWNNYPWKPHARAFRSRRDEWSPFPQYPANDSVPN